MVNLNLDGLVIEDVDLVIFDKDGTLMELYHYWSQMINMRARLICDRLRLSARHRTNLAYVMGVDEANKRLRPEGPVGVKKREIVIQAAVDYLTSIGHSDPHELCSKVFQQVDVATASDLQPLINPIDGAYALVHTLADEGCKVAIATTDKTERGELAVEFLGLKTLVDLVVGSNAVERSKPDPDMIELILNRLGVDRSRSVMVGDAITDVQMGINARLRASVGVCSGLTPAEQLQQYTPYVVHDISHIKILPREPR